MKTKRVNLNYQSKSWRISNWFTHHHRLTRR